MFNKFKRRELLVSQKQVFFKVTRLHHLAIEVAKQSPCLRKLSFRTRLHQLAIGVAKQSTCLRLQVGAILMNGNKIISTGYNRNRDGSTCTTCPRIERNAEHGSDYSDCNAIHAERDAIESALSAGYVFRGTEVISISHSACPNCVELCKEHGINIIQ